MVEVLFCAFNTSGPISSEGYLLKGLAVIEHNVFMKYEVANATLLNCITGAEMNQQHAPHDTLSYVCYVLYLIVSYYCIEEQSSPWLNDNEA